MWITHSYAGTIKGKYDYLIFLLYQDYIEQEKEMARKFKSSLERLARNLGDRGAVVVPFGGDAEEVREHVLNKDWTKEELGLLMRTPCLLLIDTDFNEFNPRAHKWAILNVDGGMGGASVNDLAEKIHKISIAVSKGEVDLFDLFEEYSRENIMNRFGEAVFLRPNFMGFGIDLTKLYELIFGRKKV